MSIDRKIARASFILITAAICGYVLSLVKEIIAANYFGITRAMDAYYAALTFPGLVNNVLLASFGAVFIPVFIRCGLRDREDANRVASIAINFLLLLFLVGAAALFVCAPQVVRYGFRGFSPETASLTVGLLRIVCFSVVLTGAVGAMTGILNAFEHFLWPAVSNMLVAAATILFVVAGVGRWGIYTMAYGLCAGLLAQVAVLYPVTGRRGYRHRWCFDLGDPAVREMLSLALLFLIGIVTAQINIVVDRLMASSLAPGSIAALGYAGKLVQVPIMIFAGSLATAAFPFFSAQVAANRVEEMKDSLARIIRMAVFIFLPVTVALILTAGPVIEILFQRGAFDQRAADLTSVILVCYSFQLVFYGVALILGRVYLALQRVGTLVMVAVIGAALNVVLNILFVRLFIRLVMPPAAGIALSTSCVYLVAMCLCFVFLRKRVASLRGRYIMGGVVRVAVSSVAMGTALGLALYLLDGLHLYSPLVGKVAAVGISLGISAVVFVVTASLLGVDELRSVIRLLKGKLPAAG